MRRGARYSLKENVGHQGGKKGQFCRVVHGEVDVMRSEVEAGNKRMNMEQVTSETCLVCGMKCLYYGKWESIVSLKVQRAVCSL